MLILVEKREGKLYSAGLADARAAHRNEWQHTTVLGIPTLAGTSPADLLLYRRGERRKACPNKLDFGGSGHVEFSFDQDVGLFDLETVILRNAIKEAQEELRSDQPFDFGPKDFHRFGELGEWDYNGPGNRELSTLHFIRLPNDRNWLVGDSNQEFVEPVRFTLGQLMQRFRSAPDDFADGAGRILSKLSNDSGLLSRFENQLAKVAT
jgi:hypothetical protein